MHLSRLPRAFPTAHRRFFVSTVLLSRTWENETVIELRKEAKSRGLSTKGNKSVLIARIQEHEQCTTFTSEPPRTARGGASQAASPGIPRVVQPRNASNPDFSAVKLSDLGQPPYNAPVQVPYVPDFWNSAQPKVDAPLDPALPKLHVVSGSATRYDGGPTYNLEKHLEVDLPSATVPADNPPASEVGFWADLWESLGLSRSFSVRRALSEAAQAREHDSESQTFSRPLTSEERKGLYVLLGIVGGSWLVAGFVNRSAAVAEEHETRDQ